MEKDQHILFVLSGPSGAGKSTLLSKIAEDDLGRPINKYSTRKKRDEWDDTELSIRVKDDIVHKGKKFIDTKCGIKYNMYGAWYGIIEKEINEALKEKNGILIVSDEVAIKEIKDLFWKTFCPVFIWIQDIEIRNLLKRKEYEKYNDIFNREGVYELADSISNFLKINDTKNAERSFDEFINATRKCFSKQEKHSVFIERCGSWINPKFDKLLYSAIIKKNSIKDIYGEVSSIIKERSKS